jgi:hypothetical protein
MHGWRHYAVTTIATNIQVRRHLSATITDHIPGMREIQMGAIARLHAHRGVRNRLPVGTAVRE